MLNASEYAHRFERLVELEREEEMARHEREIRRLSGRERERRGRALLRMRGRDRGEGLGGQMVKFLKEERGRPLPETELSVGDLVMVSKQDPLRDDNPTGTVARHTNYSVTVVFDGRPPGFLFGDGLRLDLYVNDITFQRMKEAVSTLASADGRRREIRDLVTGAAEPEPAAAAEIPEWRNEELDGSQRRAVRRAVGADRVHLIHGPPGTGKTTTAVEVIRQHVDRGDSVLATAASNVAVDNMLEFLAREGVPCVRVGHPARVTPLLRGLTLDRVVEDHPDFQRYEELREQAFELKDRQDDLTHPSGRHRRGMSDDRIRSLAEEGRGARGVSPERIREMARWLTLRERMDELFEEAERHRERAVDDVLDAADVVLTTNSTAGSEVLGDARFDVLVLDEATQATEPSCLIPMVRADKVVMAGDHRQLPPTILSREAEEEGLGRTLFEKWAERHGDRITDLLTVQYRMHRRIMDFSGDRFYGGRLEPADEVAAHTLADLPATGDEGSFEERVADEGLRPILDPEEPVVFVSTAAVEAEERSREGSTSTENVREAEFVARAARGLLEAGLDPEQVAVIAPYADQEKRIRRALDPEALEVKTVDGFQGREKEAVLVSLTRSNRDNEIGFLADRRRLNVALTRARRKLIVVGDDATVTADPVFRGFVEYVQERGRYTLLPERRVTASG
ncbi:MAG: IGHMBP2 family helicase [Candidatus Palauibacterales bacterium]|nr:IGHMBP2 family helicase [Candidatus Palauibacterales bacterium]